MGRAVIDEEMLHAWQAELGHHCGWRFMTCPEANLRTARLAIVTLNPGDTNQPPPFWSMEGVPSYFEEEQWENRAAGSNGLYRPGGHPLQVQVQRLCRELCNSPSEAFTAQFVPFCSLSWPRLASRAETLKRCRALWKQTILQMEAKTVIAVGSSVVANELRVLLKAELTGTFPTGWGKFVMRRFEGPQHTLVSLPHLSRFKIFGRPGGIAECSLRAAAA